MKEELCKAFCDNLQIRQVPAGLAVSTGFLGPEGDRIGFYVRNVEGGLYRLEDNGVTLPALEASGLDFDSGSRGEAMKELLAEYGVKIDDDARAFTVEDVTEQALPTVAMRFVAFSLRVRDFALMTEARILGTFREDVGKLLRQSIADRAVLKENAPVSDRWNHIIVGHSEMQLHQDKIKGIVATPTIIFPGNDGNPTYLMFVNPEIGSSPRGTPIGVIVDPNIGEIVTAYFNRSIATFDAASAIWLP